MKNNSTASQSTITNVAPFREGALFEGLKDLMNLHKTQEITINPAYFEDITNLLKYGNNTETYDKLFKDNYCPNLFSVKYHFLDEPWTYGARVFKKGQYEYYFQVVRQYSEIPEGSFKLASITPTGYIDVDEITLFLETALAIDNLYWMSRLYIPEVCYQSVREVLGEGRSQSLKSKKTQVLTSIKDGHFMYDTYIQDLYEDNRNNFNLFTMDRKLYEVVVPNASYAEAWACPILRVGDRVKWTPYVDSMRGNYQPRMGVITGIDKGLIILQDDGTTVNYDFTDKRIKKI